jgi:hypothetical protein
LYSVLLVIDWAKRQLQNIVPLPTGISTAVDNVHLGLGRIGLLETDGKPTAVGRVLRGLIGRPAVEKNMAILQKTFNEFLNVLEESIEGELQQSRALFNQFESIDIQFKSLHRTVLRESDTQENQADEFLSNLWNYLLGNRRSQIKKFERNKKLLSRVREKTLENKNILREHNVQLLQLKNNLELLRKKVASNILRKYDTVIVPVEEQIQGLDDTYLQLKIVRETQKQLTRESHAGGRASKVHEIDGKP